MGDSADSTGRPQCTVGDCTLVPVKRPGIDPSGRSGPSPSGKPRRSIIDIPPEVVLIIFQSFLPSVDYKSLRLFGTCIWYMVNLCRLRLVSTSWRNLVDATPSFWVVISSTFPWSVNDTNITRSCNDPLIVQFNKGPPFYHSPADTSNHQALGRFLQLLGHTCERWRVVWLDKYSADIVPQYLASASSVIETVCLDDRTGQSSSFHLLGGETQNLQHLELQGVQIHWDCPSFRRLKSLRLFRNVGGITTDLLLEVLANNPRLEDLQVTNVEIQLSKTPSPPSIRLLQLQSIELQDLEPDILGCLLRHIEAPHCQEISIHGRYNPAFDFSFTVDESLRLFEPRLLELHQKNGSSTCYVSPTGLMRWHSVGNSDGPPRFRITAVETPFSSSLRWVERVLESMDLDGLEMALDLDGSEGVVGDPEVMSALRRLRCVTEIHVSSRENSRGIVDFLCDPSVPSSPNAVPLLPALKSLGVSYAHVTAEEILHMARTRFANSARTTFKSHELEIWPSHRDPIWSIPSTRFNLTTITEIRSIDGVTLHTDSGTYTLDHGMLAVVWDEEMGEPAWG